MVELRQQRISLIADGQLSVFVFFFSLFSWSILVPSRTRAYSPVRIDETESGPTAPGAHYVQTGRPSFAIPTSTRTHENGKYFLTNIRITVLLGITRIPDLQDVYDDSRITISRNSTLADLSAIRAFSRIKDLITLTSRCESFGISLRNVYSTESSTTTL